MTTTEAGERTVTMTVKEAAKQAKRGDHPADYKLTVESPWFQSLKPTVIYVPLDVGAGIEPNDSLTMVIRSKGLKDHGDTPYDGQKPWMYNWAFVRLAGTGNGSAPAPDEARAAIANPVPQAAAYEAQKAAVLSRDPYAMSVAMSPRQTALIQATLLAVNGVLMPKENEDIIVTVKRGADDFSDWLQGTAPAEGAGSAKERPPLVQAAEDMGATVVDEPEPEIDESQAPTSVDDLQF